MNHMRFTFVENFLNIRCMFDSNMGQNTRFSVGFPPMIREIIKQQIGILGNSEAEVVKNMILIYLAEKGLLKTPKRGDR